MLRFFFFFFAHNLGRRAHVRYFFFRFISSSCFSSLWEQKETRTNGGNKQHKSKQPKKKWTSSFWTVEAQTTNHCSRFFQVPFFFFLTFAEIKENVDTGMRGMNGCSWTWRKEKWHISVSKSVPRHPPPTPFTLLMRQTEHHMERQECFRHPLAG